MIFLLKKISEEVIKDYDSLKLVQYSTVVIMHSCLSIDMENYELQTDLL